MKDTNNGKVRVIYDAKEVMSGLVTPIFKDTEVLKFLFSTPYSILNAHYLEFRWINLQNSFS